MNGTMLGPWRLVRALGAGSFGATWQAVGEDGREAAVKLLAVDPGDEVRALSRVCHPSVVGLLDAGSAPRPYVAMEMARGKPLNDLLCAGALPSDRAVAIAAVLFDALAAVHHAGVTHGDVKPDNVIVGAGEPQRAWIVDFGMVGHTRGGTLAYAAPEILASEPRSAASDVYSAGLVFWELLHGSLPFGELDEATALARRCTTVPVPRVGPPWLREVLAATLGLDPGDRPHAAAVADTLAAHGAALPVMTVDLLRRRSRTVYVERREPDARVTRWVDEGGVVAITGPPGSGRSHLLGHLAVELHARGRPCLRLDRDEDLWYSLRRALWRLAPELLDEVSSGSDVHGRAEQIAQRLEERFGSDVTVLIDGLEGLDEGSSRVVEILAERGAARICVTAEAQPTWAPPAVALGPLPPPDLERLLSGVLGNSAELGPLVRRTHALSGGWPGPAVHYLLAAVEQGALIHRAGTWSCDEARLETLEIDLASLDRRRWLPTPATALVGATVALSVRPLPLAALALLCQAAPADVQGAVDDLIAAGLCRMDEGHLRCTDRGAVSILADAAADPASIHRRLADWFDDQPEGSLVWVLWHAAGAGDEARAHGDGHAAVPQALGEDPIFADRLAERLWELSPNRALVGPRVNALVGAGKVEQALAFGTAWFEAREHTRADVDALVALATIHANHHGAFDEALALLGRARALLDGDPPPEELLLTEARLHYLRGDYPGCIERVRPVASRPPRATGARWTAGCGPASCGRRPSTPPATCPGRCGPCRRWTQASAAA